MLKEIIYVAIILIQDIIAPPNPYDEYGCCTSCGFSWCETLQECVRPWEIYCKSLDEGH